MKGPHLNDICSVYKSNKCFLDCESFHFLTWGDYSCFLFELKNIAARKEVYNPGHQFSCLALITLYSFICYIIQFCMHGEDIYRKMLQKSAIVQIKMAQPAVLWECASLHCMI